MAWPMPLGLALMSMGFAAAALYVAVGVKLRRRRVEGDARLAWRLFTHWWFGLAALTLLQEGSRALSMVGVYDETLHLTAFFAQPLLLVYILWALLYYLVYLFTGERRAIFAIALFYGACYVLLVYLMSLGSPTYDAAAGRVAFRAPLAELSPSLLALAVFLLIAPFLGGAVAYFRLFFATDDRTQRYRIGLVAATIFVWFSVSGFSYVPLAEGALAHQPLWPLVARTVGVLAGVAILMAYHPPAWVRGRWGNGAIDDPAAARG